MDLQSYTTKNQYTTYLLLSYDRTLINGKSIWKPITPLKKSESNKLNCAFCIGSQLTCFLSFTYFKTMQKWNHFGLVFHLELHLSDSIVLQTCAFNFSIQVPIVYFNFLETFCTFVGCFGQSRLAECKQISRHLADINDFMEPCSAHENHNKSHRWSGMHLHSQNSWLWFSVFVKNHGVKMLPA